MLVLKEILARKIIKRNNELVVQLLIKLLNIVGEDPTWEDYNEIASKYPEFILRNKDFSKREGMSAEENTHLVIVEQSRPFKIKMVELRGLGHSYRL
jgi:hypothetical protein